MTPELGYGLVLLAAAGHAGWNALLKAAGDRLLTLAAIRLAGLLMGVALLPLVPPPAPESWPLLAGATAAHFAYYALLLRAYRVGDLGVVHPISRGMVPLLLAGLAWALVGERPGPAALAAVAAISLGIAALAVGAGGGRTAVLLAMATGVSVAAYSFLGGLGVRAAGSVLGFQAWLEILTGIGVLAAAAMRRPATALLSYTRTGLATGLAAGVISVLGYAAYLFAVSALPMAPVAALRESSALFAALIGAVVHREAFGIRRVAAAAVITAGIVALVAFS